MESKLDSTLSSKNIVRRGLIFQFGKTQIKSLIYQSSVNHFQNRTVSTQYRFTYLWSLFQLKN